MDWLNMLLIAAPAIWFGYEFVLFCRDLERRDKASRRTPDAP